MGTTEDFSRERAERKKGSYLFTRWLFLRLLGLIYLVAFASLGIQLPGLIGKNGILPASEWLDAVRQALGRAAYWYLPTLAWLESSDSFLQLLCWGGAGLSVLLILGVLQAPVLIGLWALYLSLVSIGQDFLSFQWDVLLLETGFLAIFFAPLQVLPGLRRGGKPSMAALWLLRALLFRLMFSSGVVKLSSGDATWWNLTALHYHYETQCIPTPLAWFAHQLPEWVQKVSVAGMFFIEIVVPFLMFGPRLIRRVAAGILIAFQVLIAATGNYTFFNLLTVALCVLLLDDGFFRKLLPRRLAERLPADPADVQRPLWFHHLAGWQWSWLMKILERRMPHRPIRRIFQKWFARAEFTAVWGLASVFFFWGGLQVARAFYKTGDVPTLLRIPLGLAEPLHLVNGYGLFRVMTTSRPEIVIEGSNDGETWSEYEFRYKPGDLRRGPPWVAPHQPRLDWQMWFAALGSSRQNHWFQSLMIRLLQGSPDVLALLGKNPFPDGPPHYLRAKLYDYRFTDFTERRATGAFWKREPLRLYFPKISRDIFLKKPSGGPR